jgi:PAS domain S-box-containing protein
MRWTVPPGYEFTFARVLVSMVDITSRKQSEEALRNSEKWLATTLNSVGDAVITTDINGRVSFLNTVAVQLTGWTIAEARDRPLEQVFRIVSEQTREPAENPVTKVLADKTVVALANHTALIARDGTEVPIADSGAPIMDHEGNILGVVLVFRDVSEQRAREASLRQQQKLEAIGTLAGGVAHEINNPIGIIMNFAEIIIHDAAGHPQIQDHARTVFTEGERIAVIVRNLLQFSRHEKESYSPALINDIVGATLSLTNKVLAKDQITITTDIPPDLPKIKCRSQQLMQVLMNLITNARDALNARHPAHHDDKIIAVTVRLRELEGKRWIRTTVEDHGVGIAPEIGPRIFDPFFTTKPRDQGTGLGLSISHGIVRDHGGELTYESEPGSFTRFHIDLPVDNGWKRTGPD